MTVVVPSADVANYELYNRVNTLATQVTNASGNGKLAYDFTKLKAQVQLQLVLSLLASGKILPANVLANETYAAAQDGGSHG